MNTQTKFKLNQIIAVLEHCFGRIPIPMAVILNNITDQDIEFYYYHFKRLGAIRI